MHRKIQSRGIPPKTSRQSKVNDKHENNTMHTTCLDQKKTINDATPPSEPLHGGALVAQWLRTRPEKFSDAFVADSKYVRPRQHRYGQLLICTKT
ncbi:hypothetical protein PoB_005633200 [Plakobranchus ocellatus]|uniref:Uncharacterized protein n=1 Tax=Plakobranchus ocellatus TaxID=259542 RepID=A0AAV4CEQ5_9GAST|nr:hypothetical protein PoB_005633200 [Plakobranchus ocellatus]